MVVVVVVVVVAAAAVVVVVEVVVLVHKVFFGIFGAWKLVGKTSWIELVGLFQSKKQLKVIYSATKLPNSRSSTVALHNPRNLSPAFATTACVPGLKKSGGSRGAQPSGGGVGGAEPPPQFFFA